MVRPVCRKCGVTAVLRREFDQRHLVAWRCQGCWKVLDQEGLVVDRPYNEKSSAWLSADEANAYLKKFNYTVDKLPFFPDDREKPKSPPVQETIGACRICGAPGATRFAWLSAAPNGWDYLCKQHQANFMAQWGDAVGMQALVEFAVSDMGATVA